MCQTRVSKSCHNCGSLTVNDWCDFFDEERMVLPRQTRPTGCKAIFPLRRIMLLCEYERKTIVNLNGITLCQENNFLKQNDLGRPTRMNYGFLAVEFFKFLWEKKLGRNLRVLLHVTKCWVITRLLPSYGSRLERAWVANCFHGYLLRKTRLVMLESVWRLIELQYTLWLTCNLPFIDAETFDNTVEYWLQKHTTLTPFICAPKLVGPDRGYGWRNISSHSA